MTTQLHRNTRRLVARGADETGVALITALLAVMLMSAMMVGMFAALSASQRADMQDRDQTQAYAAAHAGLEKLTSSLAQLFATDWSPNSTQINNLTGTPPVIPGFAFTAPGGAAGSGYAITFTADGSGNPKSATADITTGPFTGFKGIITPYQVTVTAAAPGGSEVRLRREIQTVAVPVLQFGVFSDSDLTFYAGDNFDFGGRVHTNKSLFVCEFGGTMTFSDRITAYEEVVHNYLSNGLSATTYSCTGQVLIPTSSSTNRNLKQSPNEGSVTGMPGPGQTPNPNWTTISTGGSYSGGTYYKSWIRTGLTGAKKLDLPLTSQGAAPIALIRRPAVTSNEDTANKPVFGQRYFSQASLRIVLSDRTSDITALPTATGGAPVLLAGNWLQAPPTGYAVGANVPPIALSRGPASVNISGNSSSPTPSIRTASIPAVFLLPTLTVNTSPVQTVSCTGKTPTTFTGCTSNSLAVIPNTTTITASGGALPAGFTASTAATAQTSARTNLTSTFTMTVSSTLNFSVNTFFINGVLWQCGGYDSAGTVGFTSCTNAQGTSLPTSGSITTAALASQGEPLIGGYIKIDKQDAAGNWSDVTAEILGLGIGAPNQEGNICSDPTPNAIIRIQRLRDNAATATACSYNNSTNPYDWWPNTLYDPREGNFRTVATTANMNVGGVMQYISLDVGNLKKWLAGTIGTTGSQALNNNGFIIYFSDRRGDHNENDSDKETAQYAYEDQVNPTSAAGTPDGTLQTGEDMNGNGIRDVWGQTPSTVAGVIPAGSAAPYSSGAGSSPQTAIPAANAGIARVNKVVLFRRALKLVNGGISGGVNNLPAAGLTIASENPVYVQGNYNASAGNSSGLVINETHVPAAIVADAVTLLSNNWTDQRSFRYPNAAASRPASTTGYRFGAVAGKGLSFPHCGGYCGSSEFLFGTDGGVGNFLRLLEDWNAPNASVNYRGSLISLFISNQATGTFKYNTNVYDYANRNFSFDTDFLTPELLPPGTPMFRDINTLKFRQILRPNQ
jgi:hypothetical protein